MSSPNSKRASRYNGAAFSSGGGTLRNSAKSKGRFASFHGGSFVVASGNERSSRSILREMGRSGSRSNVHKKFQSASLNRPRGTVAVLPSDLFSTAAPSTISNNSASTEYLPVWSVHVRCSAAAATIAHASNAIATGIRSDFGEVIVYRSALAPHFWSATFILRNCREYQATARLGRRKSAVPSESCATVRAVVASHGSQSGCSRAKTRQR